MKKLLSIIIPAYNSEKYIEKAIESILVKNHSIANDVEIIVVNDGSTDSTMKKLLFLSEKYNQLKVYSKANGNWGSVVNYVKNNKLASGKYITILDSDDWYIENKLFEMKNHFLKDFDLIISNFSKQKNNKVKKANVGFFRKSREILKATALTPWSMPLGKFIRKEIFYKQFDLEHNKSFQDMILFNEIVHLSKKIFYYKESIGIWNLENENSSTNSQWNKKQIDIFMDNLNFISKRYQNRAHNGYCIYYFSFIRKYIKKYNYKIKFSMKETSFEWIPLVFRFFAKTSFYLLLRKYFTK